jgi:uncharacterized phage protein (TIGR01671 family)
MREIKFRIWFEVEKNMDYEPSTDDSLLNANFGAHFGEVYMQYTGLKDKNGAEIYEGDIIRERESMYMVRFDEWYLCYAMTRVGDPETEYKQLETSDNTKHGNVDTRIEVIGNIYENPELLETKDKGDLG